MIVSGFELILPSKTFRVPGHFVCIMKNENSWKLHDTSQNAEMLIFIFLQLSPLKIPELLDGVGIAGTRLVFILQLFLSISAYEMKCLAINRRLNNFYTGSLAFVHVSICSIFQGNKQFQSKPYAEDISNHCRNVDMQSVCLPFP